MPQRCHRLEIPVEITWLCSLRGSDNDVCLHRQVVSAISHVVRMSVYGYRGRRFEPRQHQYVVSLSKTLYPHCFSRLSCEMSTRWGQRRELCFSEEVTLKNHAFFTRLMDNGRKDYYVCYLYIYIVFTVLCILYYAVICIV